MIWPLLRWFAVWLHFVCCCAVWLAKLVVVVYTGDPGSDDDFFISSPSPAARPHPLADSRVCAAARRKTVSACEHGS